MSETFEDAHVHLYTCWGCSGTDNNGNVLRTHHYVPNDEQISGWSLNYQDYTYDSLNRLSSVTEIKDWSTGGGGYAYQQSYAYDRWGNRTINQGQTWGSGINNTPFNVDTATNRLQPGGVGTISYDAAGNQTYDNYSTGTAAVQRFYDAENRMTETQNASNQPVSKYTYDAAGKRMRRELNGTTTWQVYGFDGELVAEYGANAAPTSPQKEYGYRNGELLLVAQAAAGANNTAVFNGNDTTTQGTWQGRYGADGYALANDTTSYPAYAQVSLSGQASYTWAGATADGRALQKPAGSDRIAATWYSGTAFTIDVNLTDGQAHQVALYCLDWDGNNGRAERIDVLDAASGAVVDSQTVATFSGGRYLRWQVRGHVQFRVTCTGIWNAVVSGLFFGAPNLAFNQPATQSSTGWGGAASRAVDGNTSGAWADGSIAHTDYNAQVWWQVDLGSVQPLGRVDFWLMTECCSSHGDFDIKVSADGTNWTSYYVAGPADNGSVAVSGSGRYVRVQLRGTHYLALAEVRVYGSSGASGGTGGGTGGVEWLVSDQLGTPRMVVDQSGSLASVKRHDYLPFGEEVGAGIGGRTQAHGYGQTDNVRQHFTGYERDNETGLDYAQNRYYSSTQARFTSVDPLNIVFEAEDQDELYTYIKNPQIWNRYAYALNNPLRLVDPDGLNPQPVFDYKKLNDDERRILENSKVKVGNETLRGQKLFDKLASTTDGQKSLAGFLNLTAKLGSISFSVGGQTRTALSFVQSVSSIQQDRIYVTVDTQLKTLISSDSRFSKQPGHEGHPDSFKETGPVTGQLQLSFDKGGGDVDADIDLYNIAVKTKNPFKKLEGVIGHTGEVLGNKVSGGRTDPYKVYGILKSQGINMNYTLK